MGWFKRVEQKLDLILKEIRMSQAQIDQLTQDLAQLKTVVSTAVTEIGSLAAQAAAQAASSGAPDPTLTAIHDQIQAVTATLAAAVAPPAPAAAPTPAPDAPPTGTTP